MPKNDFDSKLSILKSAHHRNGIGGAPFKVAVVADPEEDDVKLVIMFEEPWHTAVLSLAQLQENGNIEFGENSWRGDYYEVHLRDQLFPKEEEL
jgi:hypothetical protein